MFAIASAAGVVLIAYGFGLYRRTGWIDVWYPPQFLRHITIGLMLFSVILVIAAYLPGHIKTWAKHPMLAAVKIWAFAHLLSNGDLGSIILFGSFLAWAVYARIAVKRREARGEVTNIQSTGSGWTNDAIAVVVGIFIYLALGFTFHPVDHRRASVRDLIHVGAKRGPAADRARYSGAQRRRADRLPDLLSRAYRAHRSTSIATSSWSATRSAW